MGKRILAGLLCALLVVVLLPKMARAAGEISVNLADGDVQILAEPNASFSVQQKTSGQFIRKGFGALSDTSVRITMPSNTTPTSYTVDVSVSGSSEVLPLKITLDNVNMNAVGRNALKLDGSAKSHVLLTLKGTNTLTSDISYAAVHVPKDASLTIQGDGALKAIGGTSGAGIGGSNASQMDCGSVTIKSGTVRASGGGHGGAGIGGAGSNSSGNGGNGGNGGNITITGGTVIASGGSTGAGIGGGGTHDSNNTGNGGAGGTATITGGTVYAWDGGSDTSASKRGAAIGGGGCLNLGSGSVGANATVKIGSFAYEWVHMNHVASLLSTREYSLDPFAGSNTPGFVGIRPPLTISPASGVYGGPISVTVRSSAANIDFIKYTLDGSDPKTSPSAQIYSVPFTVMPSVQVKAYAEDHGLPTYHSNNSAVVTAIYTLGGDGGGSTIDVPKTGDRTPLALLIGLALLSGAGLAVFVASRRRTSCLRRAINFLQGTLHRFCQRTPKR